MADFRIGDKKQKRIDSRIRDLSQPAAFNTLYEVVLYRNRLFLSQSAVASALQMPAFGLTGCADAKRHSFSQSQREAICQLLNCKEV
jgi:hypothetical protein